MYGLILHGHAHTPVANSLLIIMVQHIQSLHARDEIKLITYATYFRDGHAPPPRIHHATVFPWARKAFNAKDLRMVIAVGQQLEAKWI